MEQAKRTLRETTVETTRAVAQTATGVASDVASRTRNAALDARDQGQAHPYAVSAVGAGIGLGYWLMASALRRRRRLVPREWTSPSIVEPQEYRVESAGESTAEHAGRVTHVAADPIRGGGHRGLADLDEPRVARDRLSLQKGRPRLRAPF